MSLTFHVQAEETQANVLVTVTREDEETGVGLVHR